MKRKVELFMDSGAFSAWTRKQTISLPDYIAFLKEFQEFMWQYVSLDVIPGARDEKRTGREVEQSALASYKNHQTMKDAGLSPIPVFHMGEHFTHLERMLKDGEKYIGISPAKDVPHSIQTKWLDECFTALTTERGVPFIKIHGFATTQTQLLLRYPFYSVDSTTWSLTPGMGQIIIPAWKKDRFDFLCKPVRVGLGEQILVSANNRKYDYLGQQQREVVQQFLRDYVGCSVLETRYSTSWRRRAVARYFQELTALLVGRRFEHRGRNLHREVTESARTMVPLRNMHFHMIFATNLSNDWSTDLTDIDARYRLLSFYELRNRPERVVPYVTHGKVNPDYKRAIPKPNGSAAFANYIRLCCYYRLQQPVDEVTQ